MDRLTDRIIATAAIYEEVDGLHYLRTEGGMYASYHLRIIADELDRRNEPQQKRLDQLSQDIENGIDYSL